MVYWFFSLLNCWSPMGRIRAEQNLKSSDKQYSPCYVRGAIPRFDSYFYGCELPSSGCLYLADPAA